jgi:hypothetical protein
MELLMEDFMELPLLIVLIKAIIYSTNGVLFFFEGTNIAVLYFDFVFFI